MVRGTAVVATQEAPAGVTPGAGPLGARARVVVGARHLRGPPDRDVAVAWGGVVADRADVGAQDAPAGGCLGEGRGAVAGEAPDAAQAPERPRQVFPQCGANAALQATAPSSVGDVR